MNASLANSRRFVITLGLLTATAALTVDLSLPAIPAMTEALRTTLSASQKIVGVFMAGMAIGQIPSGLAADRFGRLPVLFVGTSVFTLAAVAASIVGNIDHMLLARFVQGLGAAPAIVVSRAIVRDVAHGREAARLMSLMTMIFTVAPVVAPSVGALMLAQWSWRAPFIGIAVCGFAMLVAIRANLPETHTPDASRHPARQLAESVVEFFSHRQSVFSFLLLTCIPAGYLSIIAVSAALVIDIYGYTEQQYGLIFAAAGISILAGSIANRWLVTRFDSMQLVSLGTLLIFIASGQLVLMAWAEAAPFAWLWSAVCLYMFTVSILMANATVIALDPLPRIAGVASSILGTSHNVAGALGALLGAALYDGSVRNAIVIMAGAGIAVTAVFLARPLICPMRVTLRKP